MALILMLLGISASYSQESRTEICIDFRVNSSIVDSQYKDNAGRISEIVSFLKGVSQDSTQTIPEVSFCGAASPEGSYQLNRKLANGRLSALEKWIRQLHVKTNGIGLAMAIANLGVEIDICKHLSFTLPVYYSAWDYFKSTIKFRTFCVQPEFRYWFKPDNEGWFVGAHFGAAFYNFALDGDYRYQDHKRETPSMGGGISAGYRTHLSKNKRWKMEFALGGGVYDSHYDKFRNTPDVKEGLLVGDKKKVWYGVDQVAVSLAYTFDLTKKGGKK